MVEEPEGGRDAVDEHADAVAEFEDGHCGHAEVVGFRGGVARSDESAAFFVPVSQEVGLHCGGESSAAAVRFSGGVFWHEAE